MSVAEGVKLLMRFSAMILRLPVDERGIRMLVLVE